MNAKDYRKALGFTNKGLFQKYLGAKDIVEPNWSVIEKKNARLVEMFTNINQMLCVAQDLDIEEIVVDTTRTIRDNNILPRLNNHGRAVENVYYSWLQGYLAELVFTPLIKQSLMLKEVERNGGDDLSDIETFKRTGDADLIAPKDRVLIDVQAGFTGGTFDIKKHKVMHAMANDEYDSYVFFADLMNGTYANIQLKPLVNEEFVPNPQWEGQLCYTVDPEIFQTFVKNG